MRDSSPSDDETLARRLEKKIFPSRCLEKDLGDKGESDEEDSQEQGIHEDYDDKYDVTPRSVKGLHGNPGAILKEIGVMKSKCKHLVGTCKN